MTDDRHEFIKIDNQTYLRMVETGCLLSLFVEAWSVVAVDVGDSECVVENRALLLQRGDDMMLL